MRSARLAALALVLTACTSTPAPTGLEVLLRVEISGAGVVQGAEAIAIPPELVPGFARPIATGELSVEVLDGDTVTFEGARGVHR